MSKAKSRLSSEVVARLLEQLDQEEDQDTKNGYEAGLRWASTHAGIRELKRLRRHYEQAGSDWDRLFDTGENDAYSVADGIFFVLDPSRDGERAASSDFWGAQGDDSDWFVKGFCDAALDVWNEFQAAA